MKKSLANFQANQRQLAFAVADSIQLMTPRFRWRRSGSLVIVAIGILLGFLALAAFAGRPA